MSLLTVPIGNNAPHEVHAIIEIPKGSSNEYFFAVYKELEQKETEVLGWQDRSTAYDIITEAGRRQAGSVPS